MALEQAAAGRLRASTGADVMCAAPWVRQAPVYVVEDEPGIRDAIILALHRAGYDVEGFSDVESFAERLGEQLPFFVVLDVSLERSDAVEALQRLGDVKFDGAVQLLSGRPARLLDDIRMIGQTRGIRMLPALIKPCRLQAIKLRVDQEASLRLEATSSSVAQPEIRLTSEIEPRASPFSLEDALNRDAVEVWYQPKIDFRTGCLVGAECLSRLREPGGATVLPASFLPGASPQTMERLTELVVRRATADWNDFSAAGRELKLSLNIPSEMLGTYPLAALIRTSLLAANGSPKLVLEITEEDALRDVAMAREAATQLSIYGVELSVDDFGVGYSAFSRLQEIPFAEIKLDRSLVQGCATDRVRGALCKAVVDLAHTLGAVVVGEGIEAAADLLFLRSIDCDLAQGYLLGRPMPKADLVAQILTEALDLDWSRPRAVPRVPADPASGQAMCA